MLLVGSCLFLFACFAGIVSSVAAINFFSCGSIASILRLATAGKNKRKYE
jgi:hypothetical protein